MQTTVLGRTGLNVSIAYLGAGGKSKLGQTAGATTGQSVALVQTALDAGINLIDTAASYGTEAIVGAAVKGRRDKAIISTKLQIHRGGTAPTGLDLIDAAELRRRLERSLAALGTDYVDLLHLHAVTLEQYPHCREVLLPALQASRAEGKCRFLCLTERFNTDTRHAMLEAARGDDFWDVIMVGFNYLNQTAAREVLPAARLNRVGTLCMYAVRGPLATPRAAQTFIDRLVACGEIDPRKLDADPLAFMMGEGTLADAAYRFCRHAPGIDVVGIGTGSVEHLRENLRSLERGPLPGAVTARIADIFGGAGSQTGEP